MLFYCARLLFSSTFGPNLRTFLVSFWSLTGKYMLHFRTLSLPFLTYSGNALENSRVDTLHHLFKSSVRTLDAIVCSKAVVPWSLVNVPEFNWKRQQVRIAQRHFSTERHFCTERHFSTKRHF